ncbi:hypothetical protein HIDPHFAB_02926 [Nocardioides sp. T2.26MG-1]|nr:DUF2249 domain-containing protein [Nocardioides sp. T2.26MG-1]CAI9417059.1 hypothetical protein HIDPHFAB_02926 [Nocardioides sp. T2.26MG-1]
MNDLMVASTAADARAAEAMVAHHAAMAGTLTTHVAELALAARSGRPDDAERVRAELLTWCRTDLVPHALAEEAALYPTAAAQPTASLLVTAMITEHQLLLDLVDQLGRAGDAVTAAVVAGSLRTVFESHLGKENDLLVPLLATSADASLAALLDGMHEELEHHAHDAHDAHDGHDHAAAAPAAGHGHGHGGCGCGESDAAGYPELDVRTIPHAIRHATVFGAVDGVRPGSGLVLVAPHDPLPLLAQLESRHPGVLSVEYLERGPEAWRLQIVRS